MTGSSMNIWVIHFSYVFFQVLYVINVHVGTYKCVPKLIALYRHSKLWSLLMYVMYFLYHKMLEVMWDMLLLAGFFFGRGDLVANICCDIWFFGTVSGKKCLKRQEIWYTFHAVPVIYELLLAFVMVLEVIWHTIIIGFQVHSKADPCPQWHWGSFSCDYVGFLCITIPLLHILFSSDTTCSWQLTASSKLFSLSFTWKFLV